ncbi:MAG: FAD-dependent oxidoreductase, partial [Rhodocyclaceae bacterium]
MENLAEELRPLAKVAIIGAGYAGMAAATELATHGISVTVFESSRVLGGRARAIETTGTTVDNGQHILIGAYRESLRLMRQVGADPQRLLLRLPLTLAYPGQLRVATPRLPAPLHLALGLLGARGLSWSDKLAAIRFMRALKHQDFRLPDQRQDCSVSALLDTHRQPDRLRTYLWEPLCVAALNTPADAASAQVFLNVLRDSLAAERSASDLLL